MDPSLRINNQVKTSNFHLFELS